MFFFILKQNDGANKAVIFIEYLPPTGWPRSYRNIYANKAGIYPRSIHLLGDPEITAIFANKAGI